MSQARGRAGKTAPRAARAASTTVKARTPTTGRGLGETLAARRARARTILRRLQKAYPDARIALNFDTPLQLLVATILSAQCTDERVNMVTPALFASYPNAEALATADLPALERAIHSTGFYRAKAKSIKAMARALVERHSGRVPHTREELTALPGVGLKTANVVLGNAFGQQALAVDTHVFRVSQRLGLARGDDPDVVHDQLVTVLPGTMLTEGTHLLIAHGRRTCTARRPACPVCPVRDLCPWPDKTRA
jgi:endonuclease-3